MNGKSDERRSASFSSGFIEPTEIHEVQRLSWNSLDLPHIGTSMAIIKDKLKPNQLNTSTILINCKTKWLK